MAHLITNDPRWSRMRPHDATADGTFFYSVKTSGVYCLPSCNARPARPENMAFHHSGVDARHAGFRPCKRCKPDQFEQKTGKYAMKENIQYTIQESDLGPTLVAASDKGLCAILIDNSSKYLVDDLKTRFPQAVLEKNDAALEKSARDAVACINNPKVKFDGKLDMRGTDFQQKVWNHLRKIPAGKTASYTDVANALGSPSAVRAVAGACAANALAVVIPCHRIVKSDGGISGYRWGVERKRQLLQMEGAK